MNGDDGGPALFRLVRFWSRRWARGIAADGPSLPQHVLVLDAVHSGAGDEATVGDVAHQLGLDHSGASRMAAATADAGYLERTRARADARRSVLSLTPAGAELLRSSRDWQRSTFVELTSSWSERDRTQFASYLERLAREVGA